MVFFNRLKLISFVILLFSANKLYATNNNHYLPLKTDPLIELELEKLSALAKMPILAKPYHLATIQTYLSLIEGEYPELHGRLKSYIDRYRRDANITSLSVELAYSDFDHKNLPNQRGRDSDSRIQGQIAGYWQLSDNFNLSLGGSVFDDSAGFVPHNTYLSYYNDYVQFDLGYKETWLSALQESAMLLSTNATPIARFSLSNPAPLTDYQVNYHLSFGRLEEMQGIKFADEAKPGKPGFIAMHLSAQPLDGWTLGLSRTMVFGGGDRKVGLGDVWDAIIDPINNDNCGGESELQDCDQEFGNQQASMSTKVDFYFGMPISIYFELAGEDSGGFRWYSLGNRAYNLSVFLPKLDKKSSLLIEHQIIRNAWYIHHLYEEGYRNNRDVMGHWWGDEKEFGDGIGAHITTIRYNRELSNQYHVDFKFATLINVNHIDGNFDESKYERGNELTIGISQIEQASIWRYQLYMGNDNFGNDFTHFSVKYSWQ